MKFADFLKDQEIFQNGYQARQPQASIVMPTYTRNAEGLLTQCIESVLNQTCENFEFIIVDDGSSDGSQDVIMGYARLDSRIVYVRHNTNAGLPALRTDEGILLARAPYVCFIFDDNMWFPDTLQVMLDTIQSSQVDLVYGLVEIEQEKEKVTIGTVPLTLEVLRMINTIPNGAVMCSRRFFEKVGLYDPHLILCRLCDWDLWLRALRYGIQYQSIDQILGVELGVVSPNSLGNTVHLDYKVALPYIFDSDKKGERTAALLGGSILEYDVFDAEKLMPFVRDVEEWERLRDSIYEPFFKKHPAFHYEPPVHHNRRYDNDLNGYRINAVRPVFKNRRRILILTNRFSRIVQDWVDALAYDPDNIVIVSSEWSWTFFTPQEIDQLIAVDCEMAATKPFLYQCQNQGVSIISLVVHGMDKPYSDPLDPLAELDLTKNQGIQQLFNGLLYFGFPGVPWFEFHLDDVRPLLAISDQVVLLGELETTNTVEGLTPYTLEFIPNNPDGQDMPDTSLHRALYLTDGDQLDEASLEAAVRLLANTPSGMTWTVYLLPKKVLPEKLQEFASILKIIMSFETLPSLMAHSGRTLWAVPQNIMQRYEGYHRLMMEEDLVRSGSCVMELIDPDLSASLTYEKCHEEALSLREKVLERAHGCRSDARFLHILNISQGVALRKKIIGFSQKPKASSVKSMVLINSQALAGSEAYGLLVVKALTDIGFDVQAVTHASFDQYVPGMKNINDWLEARNLRTIVQAEYGKVSRSLYLPEVPEEGLQQYSDHLRHWLDSQGIDLVFSSAFISEPLVGWKEDRLIFMALFAPWDYHLQRMGYLRYRVNGLVSDTNWAANLWGRWMSPPIRCIPSMVERDYFRVRNAHLPTKPICIALTGTIQPRKRQREAVRVVLNLVKQGYDLRLNLYGYEVLVFNKYIEEVKELAADPIIKDRVTFHGFVDDPMEIPRDNHIVFMPSTDESLPQGMIFNQAAGLIAVACPAGGVEEMVEDGVTGFLAKGFTVEDCTEALQHALDRQSEWPAIAARARQVIRDRCSEQIFTFRLLEMMNRGAEIHLSEGRRCFYNLSQRQAESTHRWSAMRQRNRYRNELLEKIDLTNLVIGPDISQVPVHYSLACDQNHLAGCIFLVGTFHTHPSGCLRFALMSKRERCVLREVKMDLIRIHDNQWARIEFEPIHNSSGQIYTIMVSGDVQNGRVALYESLPSNTRKFHQIALKSLQGLHQLVNLPLIRYPRTLYPVYAEPIVEELATGVDGDESVPDSITSEPDQVSGALEPVPATVALAQPPGGRALRTGEYHDGLQALRGIAAMGVFCYHLIGKASRLTPGPIDQLSTLNTGGIGVLIFFALSGFLISSKAGDPPLKFLLDRARRIFPTFWLAIAAALLWSHCLGAPMSVPWDIAFLIPTGRPNRIPLPHWSLYFEWFFYALVLLVALVRIAWVRPAVIIWAVLAFALYGRPYNFANYNAPDLYNLVFPLYAVYFAVGILAGWRFTPTPRAVIPYALTSIAAFYALQVPTWLKIYVFYSYLPAWAYLELAYAFAALGAFCAVRAALCWQPRWFFGKVLKALGDASYGIYLMHLITMDMAVRLIKSVHTPSSYLVSLILILALALPPAFLFGLLDVRLQRALKRVQQRLGKGRAERQSQTSPTQQHVGL